MLRTDNAFGVLELAENFLLKIFPYIDIALNDRFFDKVWYEKNVRESALHYTDI